MKGKNGYIFYALITAAVMAIALFVPSLRLPKAEADISSASADSASGNGDGNVSYIDTAEEGSSLTYLEKIQAVGATIAKHGGYAREEIENSDPDKTEALEQFKQIIQKLYENSLLDESTYNDLLMDASFQAITEYNYTKDAKSLFILRIIERTYYNVSSCSKMAISVGLDRETGGVIYLYLNFYGLYEGLHEEIDVEDRATDVYWVNWPNVLGFTGSFSPVFSVELETSDSLRIHAKYQLSESSAIYYKFGFGYESREDRYQIFMEPAVS